MWQVKAVDQLEAGPVRLTGQTGTPDQSDRSKQLVRPVEPSTNSTPKSVAPVSATHVDEVRLVPPGKEDEELVDYEASPEHTNLEINVVHLSSDYFVVRKRIWLIFSLGPVKLCSRSQARRTTI